VPNGIKTMCFGLGKPGLNLIQIAGKIVLIPIIAFSFLLDWDRMLNRMRRLIPRPYEKILFR